jgi:uncharacterized Fe-S center protein
MKSVVLFTDARFEKGKGGLGQKWEVIIEKSELGKIIKKGEKVAVKLHMGERGNIRYIRPYYVRVLVRKIIEIGGSPFLYDTTVIYKGSRQTVKDYLETARDNGFTEETTGCPIIIEDESDGIEVEVPSPLRLKKIRVGKKLLNADALINLAHFTFHMQFPFGAAIKNIGMGGVLKSSKEEMHGVKGTKPRDLGLWEATIDGAKFILNHFKNKVYHFNLIIDVTPDCDCFSKCNIPVVPDIGIMGSSDPVALDKASWDMVSSAPIYPGFSSGNEKDKLKILKREEMDPELFFSRCRIAGIGKIDYDLLKI